MEQAYPYGGHCPKADMVVVLRLGESTMSTGDNRAVVITGASTGIGAACALHLDRVGFAVFAGVRKPEDGVALQKAGSERLVPLELDVTDLATIRKSCAVVLDATKERGLFGLINNAGIADYLTITEASNEAWQKVMAVNLDGVLFGMRAIIPHMQAKGRGSIINISSIWGMTGAPVAPHYCGAKAALLGMTKAWAKEFAPWNIHVNAVAPGGVLSGGPLRYETPEQLKAKQEKVLLGRYAQPVEISFAVAFLASPEADFITGQVISPNGGDVIVGI